MELPPELMAVISRIPNAPNPQDPKFPSFVASIQQKWVMNSLKANSSSSLPKINSPSVPQSEPSLGQTNDIVPLVPKENFKGLVQKLGQKEKLDAEVEDLLSDIIVDFVSESINSACKLTKHRQSNMLEIKDIVLPLDKKYNIVLPGYGTGLKEIGKSKSKASSSSHVSRVVEVRDARTRANKKRNLLKK